MLKGIIELEGMEFFAHHGCLESERLNGNRFVVDFKADAPVLTASRTDKITHTLDYADIYKIVAKEMETPSNLLENVAGRIVQAIAAAHPHLRRFQVRVSKAEPPLDGKVEWAHFTLMYEA